MKQPAAHCLVWWLQTTLVLALLWLKCDKVFAHIHAKEAHHGPNQLDRPGSTLRNITHWALMEDMKQSSSTLLGLVTANNQTIVNSSPSLTNASNATSQATKAAVNATNNQANPAKASGSAGVNSPPWTNSYKAPTITSSALNSFNKAKDAIPLLLLEPALTKLLPPPSLNPAALWSPSLRLHLLTILKSCKWY
jgi:hypothetical protein